MSKTKIVSMFAIAAVVIGVSTITASVINAQVVSTNTNPMSSLVTAIATKFNLNAAEVQTVVDETMQAEHAAREAQMQQAQAARLSAAVTAGKLTQAQADLITAKTAELRATMEANRIANQSLTMEQRKAKMDEQRTALQAWATANNIPTEYLHFVGGGKGMGVHGGMGMKGFRPGLPTTNTTSSTIGS
jgi:hypothetical protein